MSEKNKRKLIFFSVIVAAIVILAIVIVIQTSGSMQGYRTICVIETSGTVVVVKDGIEYPAYSGMMLQEGYEIITSGDSYARLALDGDKYIKLESGSKLVFETLGLLGSGKTKMHLERGAFTNELVSPLQEDEEYLINTPNAVLAVRGTFFRVDLNPTKEGELIADIITYGGQVATKRILPSGEVIDEELLVDAGHKVCINMDSEWTVYVVDGNKLNETGEDVKIETIDMQNISDEDIVDIYFSVQNGHDLFVTEQEIEEVIIDRNIDIEKYNPVYETAQVVLAEQEGNPFNVEVYPDDKRPIVRVEDEMTDITDMDGFDNSAVSGIPPNDGNGMTSHVHVYTDKVTKEATCVGVGERTYTCNCGYSYIEEIVALGHIEEAGGTSDIHSKCSVCGEALEAGTAHSYTTEVTKEATYTDRGERTYTCDCGYSYKEEIAALEHMEVAGGTSDSHSKCSICGETLEDGTAHSYTSSVTTEATCTTVGERLYTCDCGYSYTEEISALGHTEVSEGMTDVHSKCSVCGETLEDGTAHSYTSSVTTEATCTAKGEKTYICTCGHSYTEEISERDIAKYQEEQRTFTVSAANVVRL